MSEEAYQFYAEAMREQHARNEAREIRKHVQQARGSHSALIRWPFELLQNALDAGPRDGRSVVRVRFSRESTRVAFEHDGAPFTLNELAALLSGGSSKDYESEVTTGRFGSGFLVTHVLAERVRLRVLMQLPTGLERVDLTLDRGGDEAAILENIQEANEAIRRAEPVSDAAELPSAEFEYAFGADDSWGQGLDQLRRALPYVYGTRPQLGRVELRNGARDVETWEPSEAQSAGNEGSCYIDRRAISVTTPDAGRELCVYRFDDAGAAALLYVEKTPDGASVCLPVDDAPRVFREYPLRSSAFVPVNIILDGRFETDEERSRLLMKPDDKTLLKQALSAAVVAVKYAIGQKWSNSHWLAYTARPDGGFDTTDVDETDWWTECLAAFAQRLSLNPIIECKSQLLPARVRVDVSEYADIISPRLFEDHGPKETSVERLWPLVEASDYFLPPTQELAPDWTIIAEGWNTLGLEIRLVCVDELAKQVRQDAETVEQLQVQGDPQQWLAGFVDILGECWKQRAGYDLSPLDGMLPNQDKRLCAPSELKRDEGVPERLKDICKSMGYDIRGQLLINGFEETAQSHGLCYLTEALTKAIPSSVTEEDSVSNAVKYAAGKLPEGQSSDGAQDIQRGTIRLLAYLWETRSCRRRIFRERRTTSRRERSCCAMERRT